MLIYLGHSNANFASQIDGHVLAARWCDYTHMLYSFVATNGKEFPIESLPSGVSAPELDEDRLRALAAGG